MKKYLLLLMLPLLYAGCRKDEPGFNMNYQRDFVIPAGLIPFDVHHYEITDIPADTLAFFTTNHVTSAGIKSIKPYSMRFQSIFNGAEYNFLEIVSVWIVDPADPNHRQEIFYRENIPIDEDDDLGLFPNLPDIKEFLLNNRFNMDIILRLRDPSPQTTETRILFAFRAATI